MLEDNITTRQDPQGGSPGHLGPSTITGTVTHTAVRIYSVGNISQHCPMTGG